MSEQAMPSIDDAKRWSLLLVAVVALAALAGCLGGSSSVDAASEDAGTSDEQEPTAEDEAAADASPSPSGEDGGEEEVTYVEETRSVIWKGTMPSTAFVCSPAACVYEEEPASESDHVHELGTEPMPVSAEFTLTWDDAHKDVKEMLFGIVTDGCREGCDEIVWKEGTSGVTIQVDDVELAEDDGFALAVHHTYNYHPGGIAYSAGPPVDFTVEGNYTVLAPAS